MPTNLEFKASINSGEDIKNILNRIGAKYIETIKQADTYFYTKYGRLKIREINDSIYQLIYYNRDETKKFRLSEYQICEISDVEKLKDILKNSLGVKGVVRKIREVYMLDNCRIHIDEVANLGLFIEFEYIKEPGDEKSDDLVNSLHELFLPHIKKIYRESYIDLI